MQLLSAAVLCMASGIVEASPLFFFNKERNTTVDQSSSLAEASPSPSALFTSNKERNSTVDQVSIAEASPSSILVSNKERNNTVDQVSIAEASPSALLVSNKVRNSTVDQESIAEASPTPLLGSNKARNSTVDHTSIAEASPSAPFAFNKERNSTVDHDFGDDEAQSLTISNKERNSTVDHASIAEVSPSALFVSNKARNSTVDEESIAEASPTPFLVSNKARNNTVDQESIAEASPTPLLGSNKARNSTADHTSIAEASPSAPFASNKKRNTTLDHDFGNDEAKSLIFFNKEQNTTIDQDSEFDPLDDTISPKAFVLSTFTAEAAPWHKYQNLTQNITIPGLSPLFPNVSCNHNKELCQLTVGEGPANAAASVTALLLSPMFDLTSTYFLIAGVGGIDPKFGGLGSAAFARYAVSVDSMYEVDAREKPKNWSTGYWAYGTQEPGKAPTSFYGNEVFEVNAKLRDYAYQLALNVTLDTNPTADNTNSLYNISAARAGAKVLACDVSTSEIYPTGDKLGSAATNITSTFTNGTGKYCITAQEDTAILEAALRGAQSGLTDYSRWVVLRTGADFDRPPASLNDDPVSFLFNNNTGGFTIAQENLYRAGYPFVRSVINEWNSTFLDGTNIVNGSELINGTHAVKLQSRNSSSIKNGTFAPDNYIGDVFGTLGGEPDFGPGSYKHHVYINTF